MSKRNILSIIRHNNCYLKYAFHFSFKLTCAYSSSCCLKCFDIINILLHQHPLIEYSINSHYVEMKHISFFLSVPLYVVREGMVTNIFPSIPLTLLGLLSGTQIIKYNLVSNRYFMMLKFKEFTVINLSLL